MNGRMTLMMAVRPRRRRRSVRKRTIPMMMMMSNMNLRLLSCYLYSLRNPLRRLIVIHFNVIGKLVS